MQETVKTILKWLKIIAVIVLFVVLLIYFYPYLGNVNITDKKTGFQYKVCSDHVEVRGYVGKKINKYDVEYEDDLVIPDKYWNRKITVIQEDAFIDWESLKSVKFPKYLKEIREWAFYGCESITTIELGEYVESIGISAFSACDNLESVIIKGSVRIIEPSAFWGCNKLRSITLNEGLEEIGDSAFGGTALKSITIPKSVRKIGYDAFARTELQEVDFQDNNEIVIKADAFYDTPWLEKQEGFAIYGDNVLVSCRTEETEVVIPDGVKYISGEIIGTKPIEKVYIPNTVCYIGSDTLRYCNNAKIFIPDSVIELNLAHMSMHGEKVKITIVTTSGSYAETYAKENGIEYEIVEEIIYPEE